VIIESIERKLKRTVPGLIDDLRERSNAVTDKRRFIEYAVRRAASHAASESDLVVRTKTQPADVRAILAKLTQEGLVSSLPNGWFIHRETTRELSQCVADTVCAVSS